MELEFFCEPGNEIEWFEYWKNFAKEFLLEIGLKEENIKFYDHPKEKLSFYSNATTDILYNFSWGFDELWGIASRTDYDLRQHQEYSGENLEYLDPASSTSEKQRKNPEGPGPGPHRPLIQTCQTQNGAPR